MQDILKLRSEQAHNLRQSSQLVTPRVNSVYHGTEIVSFPGPKIWNLIPNELKSISHLAACEKAIKKWSQENCPCRLYKIFVSNVDLVSKKSYMTNISY